jgi:hypothetical protein
MRRSKKTLKLIQDRLAGYLSIEIDPYDFDHFLSEWAEDRDIELPDETYVHDLTDAQRADFEKWLRAEEKASEYMQEMPAEAPAYLHFGDVEKLPRGTWLIHFSDSPFRDFEYGATMDRLALSTWWKNKTRVDCRKNLTDDIGDFERVYGFAYRAERLARKSSIHSGYGKHAVLFRSDAAVEVWHYGDEQNQVIFPLCSEYDAYSLIDIRDGISCECDGDELMSFPTLGDVIRYAETKGGRRLRKLA